MEAEAATETVEEKVEETTQETSEAAVDAKEKDKEKKEKKKSKKDQIKEELEEMTDKYTRLFAEFQNFRSRNEKEKSSMYEMGASNIIEKILPIVDNFERGIKALSEEDLKSPVGEGMNLIYKQLIDTLTDIGVKPIEAEGKEFDPDYHNAVMHEENDEVGEQIITEEFQKGYTYKDSVIRHSMVKVAN